MRRHGISYAETHEFHHRRVRFGHRAVQVVGDQATDVLGQGDARLLSLHCLSNVCTHHFHTRLDRFMAGDGEGGRGGPGDGVTSVRLPSSSA